MSGSGGAGGTGAAGASGTAGDSGAGGAGGSSGAGGSGGEAAVTYAACEFGSGIARIAITKRDAVRERCVVLILNQPGSNTLGLTLPASWGVEAAYWASPVAGTCPISIAPGTGTSAESGTGTVTRTNGFVVDVDVTLAFPENVMEELQASGLDASIGCAFE
jgi:hypothetical protein